jgi:predicted P-loop ATPase
MTQQEKDGAHLFPSEPRVRTAVGGANNKRHAGEDAKSEYVKDALHVTDDVPLILDRIPLKPRSKAPLNRGWRRSPALTEEGVAAHVASGGNVGARLRDDQLVIDADPRAYEGGVDSLDRLIADFKLPYAPTVETGGGGRHVYLRKPADVRVCGTLDGYPGVEFKTVGRQVVLPPSVHPNGREYLWDALLDDTALVPFVPDALLDQLRQPSRASVASDEALTAEQLEEALSCLDVRDFSDHAKWLDLAMSCHEATDGEGLDVFMAFSAGDPAHLDKLHTIPKRWASFDGQGGITRLTLFKLLNQAGHGEIVDAFHRSPAAEDFPAYDGEIVEDTAVTVVRPNFGGKKPVSRNYRNVRAAIEAGNFGVALNVMTGRKEMRAKNLPFAANVGTRLNDDAVNLIREWVMDQFNFEPAREDVFYALNTLATKNRFNPVLDYLDSLTWDGVSRVDSLLPHYFGAADDPYSRAVGRKLLLAMVKRTRHPGAKFDNVPILEGKQGSGKSSALRILGGEWFSDATLGKLDNKDAPALLQGKWLIEMGELNTLRRNEVNQIKEFVSKNEDSYRAAYAREEDTRPRRCVFVGTTNSDHYLQDPTGNRRFWPVATGAIDLSGLRRDRDQLFAETCVIEATGEELTLPHDIWHVAEEQQANRTVDDTWLEILGNYLVDKDLVSARELVETALLLSYGRTSQDETKRLRRAMTKLGWDYKKSIRFEQGIGAGYVSGDNAS